MNVDIRGYNLTFFQGGELSRFAVTFQDFQRLVIDGELKSPFIDTTIFKIENLLQVERYR